MFVPKILFSIDLFGGRASGPIPLRKAKDKNKLLATMLPYSLIKTPSTDNKMLILKSAIL
jgi:hypothetical protein